jgi:hypothetical protein
MPLGVTPAAKEVSLWGRLSAAIIAAGTPLPQKKHQLT